METTLYTYALYLVISVALTIWVGHTLFRNGRPFLIDVFGERADLADSVNHLLVVGFYLINFGYVTLTLRLTQHVSTAVLGIEALSQKIGMVLVVLGLMHFFNLYVFSRIRRYSRNTAPTKRLAAEGGATLDAMARAKGN
jgi:hypothetical protein